MLDKPTWPSPESRSLGGPRLLGRARLAPDVLWRNLGVTLLILLLGALTLYPLAMLLYGSLSSVPPGESGAYNLAGYRQLLRWEALGILGTTVAISLVKTVLGMAVAIALAWIVTRTDTPFRGVIEVLVTLPFFIPPILTALGWAMLGNPTAGTINLIWMGATGFDRPLVNVYSHGGVVWHLMQYTVPFAFLLMVDGFRTMDPSLEEASRMSGASRMQTFFKVTLVLMLPIVTGVFILSFIRGIEALESPLFFGLPANIHLVTTEIYRAINHNNVPDYQYATAISIAVIALMMILVLWQWRILGNRRFETVSGRGYSPRVTALGPFRWVAFSFCVLVFAVSVVLPIGQLFVSSFFKFYGFYSADMLTLEHYRAVLANDRFWRALWNTMILGFAGATATMVVGSLAAYIIVRTQMPARRLVDVLAWLPWMMPGIVVGLAFLWGFAVLPHWVPIYGTLWALMIAYITLALPLSVRVMNGALAQLSYDLEECSRVHGATWLQTFRRILIALTLPAFLVGWVLTFFMVLREVSASVLLFSIGNEPLSIVILRLWEESKTGEVSVIALLMLLLVAVLRTLHILIARRVYQAR
jgi:iron(III) transport system permease protein